MPNSNTIKITGIAELPQGLEMGFDYVVAGRIAVVSIEKTDNMDSTFTYQHKGKLTHIELANKVGKTFKGVAKGSKSQKLRWRIMEHGDEDYYQKTMDFLIDHLEEILEFLKP